jgi:hypothetical protein
MRVNPFRSALALCALFVLSAPARAGDAAPARDAFLDRLAGNWAVTRLHEGATSRHSLRAEWVLEGRFLQLHMKHLGKPSEYEALVLIGLDEAAGEYVAHWCDTFGAQYSAVGRGKRKGDAVEFVFQYPGGPFYNTFTWDAKAGGWTFRGEATGKDGGRELFALDTVRRH